MRLAVIGLCGLIGLANVPLLPAAAAPLKAIEGDPKLPRVLLIGDSISIGYTLPVREALGGKANVHRIPANSGTTANVLKNLDTWLGDKPWDVIHFNIGLHDIRQGDGRRQASPEDYDKNLRAIVARLKKTKAALVWSSTTPVPDGAAARTVGDEITYNAIAAKIMQEEKITTIDLHELVKPKLADWQLRSNVHFNKGGYKALGEKVAAKIAPLLPARKP